jgi:hypothetical protein
MNDIFKKIFDRKTVKPIFVGFGAFAIFSFIVFPGLTVANGFLNILSALIGIFSLVYIFYYIDADKLFQNVINIESGETELDYINPEELKPKKKKNPKQFDGVKSQEPFVKTRKKTKTK